VVWVRKGWEKDKEAVLVWRDSGVGVGGIVSEQRYLLSEHLQKMHVTLLSLFGRVKTVLSFRKSRVFSRTRFQSNPSNVKGLSLKYQLGLRRGAPSQAAYCRLLNWAICAIELLLTRLLYHR